MKKTKIITFLLCILMSVSILCSCKGQVGAQGPQGERGPAGKDGASFLTGKGRPSDDLGNIGDSYLDTNGDEWGFYIKEENGWKLLGLLEAEPAPLTLGDLDGSYTLSHVISGSKTHYIGEIYAGMQLSADMIQVNINNGIGDLTVNFASLITTNITCTIEYDKLIMICENSINIAGEPSSVYELTMIRDGDLYVVLEAYGDLYFVKKVS